MQTPSFARRRALITGGAGFLGSNLAHRLVAEGAQVRLLSRSAAKRINLAGIEEAVELIPGDIRDRALMERLVAEADDIFHLAGQTSHLVSMEQPILDWDINCRGTLTLIEACRARNREANLVMAGTVTQIGPPRRIPVDEELAGVPVSIYDAHKAVCERYLVIAHRSYGLRTTMLRLANVFGERQQVTDTKRGIINLMIKRALCGEPLTVYGDGGFIRDYNYVQNIVEAFLLAAASDRTKGEAYVIGSGVGTPFRDAMASIVQVVQRQTPCRPEIQFVPFPEHEARIDGGNFIADASRFRDATGWQPRVAFDDGLARTVAFYQQHLPAYLAGVEVGVR